MNSYRAICLAGGLAAGLFVASMVARLATAQSPADNITSLNRAVPAASGQLQGLIRATTTQLQIAYRHDAEEYKKRREQLAAAVAAWRAAARSAANDGLLADWLRAAIRKSMPGSREALPELPRFERPVAAAPRATATTAPLSTTMPSSTMRQKPVVENLNPPRRSDQSSRPAVEPSRVREEAVGPNAAAQVAPSQATSTDSNAANENNAERDFWSAHPANSDLPAELSGGDPFGDDP